VPPARVVPAFDPAEDSQTRLGLALEAAPVEQLAFETREEALGHGVVVGVSDRAHRRTHAHLPAAVAEGDAGVLAALIAVMDDLVGLALLDGHVQRAEHQISRHALADGPADDAAAPDVQHHRQIQEARPRRNVGHVRHPELVRPVGDEATLHQIWRRPLTRIALGGHDKAVPTTDATDAGFSHQACNACG